MLKTVSYPKFVLSGIRANHRATPLDSSLRLFASDNETFDGKPHYLTISDGSDFLGRYVKPSTVFETWRDWIFSRSRSRGVNLCYFHVLNFDSLVILYEKRSEIYRQGAEFHFDYKGCEIEGLHGKINALTIRYDDKILKVLDTYAFTTATLDRSLKMFNIDAVKMDKPARLGRIEYDKLSPDDPERVYFEAYSDNDTHALWKLARKVVDYHREYDVRLSLSLPQFAARVFRHHFFKRDEVIPFPPVEAARAAELSYHGGKNGCYLPRPTIVEDAYEADISSAFPYAMSLLPQMVKGGYCRVKKYVPGVPGVYLVSGRDHGRYPLIFDHGFRHVRDFKDLWITGHEVARSIDNPDVDLKISDGWIWIHDEKYTHNALREYVEHFYSLKEKTPKSDPNYAFFKLCLNGAYGKFCQAVAVAEREWLEDPKTPKSAVGVDYAWDDVVGDYVKIHREHRAGGLYNPFIATQITGHTRGYLYDLENTYGAFHSATDAIKSTKLVPSRKGLGGIKIETFGRCYTFRNKLYLHYARSTEFCGHDLSKVKHFDRDGQHLCKYGLHGFKGSLDDLVSSRHDLISGKPLEYEYNHMIRLREGLKRKESVCSMTTRREVLKL